MLNFINLSSFTFLLDKLGTDCGLFGTGDPGMSTIANLTSGAVFVIQVFVPIALIIMGMIDMGKAVMQQKEDDIKKAQQEFITRLIAAAITFLIITIVKLVINILSNATDSSSGNLMDCVNFFLNGR